MMRTPYSQIESSCLGEQFITSAVELPLVTTPSEVILQPEGADLVVKHHVVSVTS
jgi:hypothetical protein